VSAGAKNREGNVDDGIEGLVVCWLLLLVQGLRRLYESLAYVKIQQGGTLRMERKSTMWVGHWIMGLLFYATVNVAFWVERTGKCLTIVMRRLMIRPH
jgi:hypothetical protein